VFTRLTVRNIRRAGQESNAIAMWNGTGLTIRDSYLEGGSQQFLSGGATPDVPNHVPENILIENTVMTRPMEWRGQGTVCKNSFELKSARHVVLRNVIMENVWPDGQSGFAIVLTPSQYGNSPENVVEDVLFDNITVRNVAIGINAVGFTQHSDPTRRDRRAR
jgi:hypothetical protein